MPNATAHPAKHSRCANLNAWLDRVGARRIAETACDSNAVEFYRIGRGVAIVVKYNHGNDGWSLFVEASPKNDAVATFAAAEKALGV